MIEIITLDLKTGPIEQKSLVVGNLAGHLPTGYTISHVPTGLMVSSFTSLKWAIKCAKELAPEFPWDNRQALNHQAREIQRHIKRFQDTEDQEYPPDDDDDDDFY